MYATPSMYATLSSFCPTVKPVRANLLASKSTYAVPLSAMLLYCALRSNAYCFVSTYAFTFSIFAKTSIILSVAVGIEISSSDADKVTFATMSAFV